MKYYLAVLVLALGLAGCSSDDGLLSDPAPVSEGEAIVLDVKEVASPVTRAADQKKGSMDFTKLTTTGFGVYGYKGAYNSGSSQPTLFSSSATNTKVSFIPDGTPPTTTLVHPGNWTYATNANDWKLWEKNGNNEEKYTFFAYAPYMASDGTAPGITSIKASSNMDAGDPTIGYTVATDPTNSVDLLWGIRSDNGLPWKDIQRGQTAGAVLFTFYHALCAIGYHAQVIVDKDNNLSDTEDASGIAAIGTDCKVTIKSITLTPAGVPAKVEPETPAILAAPFHQSATLNLNNTVAHTPSWSSQTGEISSLVLSGSQIDSKILDPAPADNDATNAFLNDDTNHPGIVQTANSQAVIAKDDSGNEQFYMLIPQAAQDYTLGIKYFITYKTGESTFFRSEELTGTATINDLELKAGVKYYINLVFGLTTFKLNVQAKDWDGYPLDITVVTENGTSASQSLAK